MESILWLVAALLVVAWLLGVGGVYTVGNLVHLLLVLAVIAVVVNLFVGRRKVA